MTHVALAVFFLLFVLAAGFGVGYVVLWIGNALHSGGGTLARLIVALAAGGCGVVTLRHLKAWDHPTLPTVVEFGLASLVGLFGIGLVLALLLSFREPPPSLENLPTAVRRQDR
jgi:hypothetical protein